MKMMVSHVSRALLLSAFFVFGTAFTINLPRSNPWKAPASANANINPLKGNAAAAAEGKKLYTTYCTPCHGAKGKGDGVAAPGLQKTPADHTSAPIQNQSDGAIFWKISQGNSPMPAYKSALTETQRWQCVNFIRTLAKASKK